MQTTQLRLKKAFGGHKAGAIVRVDAATLRRLADLGLTPEDYDRLGSGPTLPTPNFPNQDDRQVKRGDIETR